MIIQHAASDLTLGKLSKETVCVWKVISSLENAHVWKVATAVLSEALTIARESVRIFLCKLVSQVIKYYWSCVGIGILGRLTKKPRDQVIPLSLARDPNAKHLGDDGEEVRDQNDQEARCDWYFGLFSVAVLTDFHHVAIVPVF